MIWGALSLSFSKALLNSMRYFVNGSRRTKLFYGKCGRCGATFSTDTFCAISCRASCFLCFTSCSFFSYVRNCDPLSRMISIFLHVTWYWKTFFNKLIFPLIEFLSKEKSWTVTFIYELEMVKSSGILIGRLKKYVTLGIYGLVRTSEFWSFRFASASLFRGLRP